MKPRNAALMALGMLAFQGAAMAEMISGTISIIDPQSKKLTLVRHDTQNPVVMSVQDQAQLLGLQPGNQVIVDANKKLFGGWEAESVTLSTGSQGNEADLNASGAVPPVSAPVTGRTPNTESSNVRAPSSEEPNSDRPTASASNMNANPTAENTY